MAIWNILFYFVVIWYIFPCFGMMLEEQSGNPAFYIRLLHPLTVIPLQVWFFYLDRKMFK
jgi:hypothetical protein